jgi:hypothetical protein
MRANVEQFLSLPLADSSRQRILYDNANRIFR